MEDDEKEEVLYHGTTHDVAQLIFAQKKFELIETYFASTRSLAEHFALRSAARRSHKVPPAVLRIVLYESDLKQWIKSKLVRRCGFDENDHTELYGKTQLIFNGEAVRFLNRFMFPGDLSIEPVVRDE
jgi:hypothetical protein